MKGPAKEGWEASLPIPCQTVGPVLAIKAQNAHTGTVTWTGIGTRCLKNNSFIPLGGQLGFVY